MSDKIWDRYKWDIWEPDKNPLPKDPNGMSFISIVTTCMNRTHDLKRTLPTNIADNSDYPHLEFVIVNYNSSDDMDEYMTSKEMSPHIKSGKVRYLRTRHPKYYSMSHSRNIGFKNANGMIVTNVDADNYTGEGFASFLNLLSNIKPRKAFFAKGKRLCHGRIGMYKDEFEYLGGYDESLEGYGADDSNLMYRAMAMKCKLMWWGGISPVDFTKRIKTPRSEVGKNMRNPRWKETEHLNKKLTMERLEAAEFIANIGKNWGYVPDLEEVKL